MVWQRGAYWDDYLWGRVAVWPSAPEPRLLSNLLYLWLAHSIDSTEWLVRLLGAAFSLAAALALGLLGREVTRSTIPGATTAMLFAAPVLAFESVLWSSASAYPLGLALSVIGLVAWLRALDRPRRIAPWALAGFGCQALAALCYEVFLPLLLLFPLFALLRGPTRRRLALSLGLSGTTLLLLGAGFTFIYQSAGVLGARGGFNLEPADFVDRATIFVQWLTTYLLSSRFGANLATEELRLGVATSWRAQSHSSGQGCAGGAMHERGDLARTRRGEGLRASVALVALGLIWAALTLFVPAALVPRPRASRPGCSMCRWPAWRSRAAERSTRWRGLVEAS